MRMVILLLLLASPLAACCPVDKDSLADEADESLLDIVAGRIERDPFSNLRSRLQAEPEAALATGAEQRSRLALTLWWLGGAGEYTPERCLEIAGEAAQDLPDSAVYKALVSWAQLKERADQGSFLPDFLSLRYAPNKTADTDTGELQRRGLANAEHILLELLQLDEAWENFDTLYALSMIYVVQGRQNLAHYARMRAWEMHAQGQPSRVPGAAEIGDIKPLTIVRQLRVEVLVPVKLVSDENQTLIEAQYHARRAYALAWQQARAEYVKAHPQNTTSYWAGFTAPESKFPPLRAAAAKADQPAPDGSTPVKRNSPQPESAEPAPSSRNQTWITMGLLLVVLVLGFLARARIARKAQQPAPPNPTPPPPEAA
ncbi:MAG: hypothetical protein H6840_03540 [Planctomycetes bacterium]|nr:hypothetical protein [Planctomycetota bacterium]